MRSRKSFRPPSTSFGLRLPASQAQALEALAQRHGTRRNRLIRNAIALYLALEGVDQPSSDSQKITPTA